jgi:dienelactone hydrolase
MMRVVLVVLISLFWLSVGPHSASWAQTEAKTDSKTDTKTDTKTNAPPEAPAAARPAFSQVQIAPNLPGVLYKPAGDGPFPAVVALHGCGGLARKKGPINARFADWGERLAAAGFVVLFPDSFSGRNLGTQCRVRARSVRASRERIADADTAFNWLKTQSFAKADHIGLIGWSNGGTTTLGTVRTRPNATKNGPDFRSAIAFYPGCRRLRRTAWSARVPTLVLIGASDDWTPAKTCQQMVDNARGRSALAQIITYPNAYHEFDRANHPVRVRLGVSTSADGTGRVHVGTNTRARADSIKRVSEWLAR